MIASSTGRGIVGALGLLGGKVGRRLEVVRPSAREQLVEHGAERVGVSRGGHVLIESLLRGEVGRGTKDGLEPEGDRLVDG